MIVGGVGTDGGVADGGTAGATTACQAPEAVMCVYNSQCTAPLVCSGDKQCRDRCQVDRDCATGQKCTTTSKVCIDPVVDKAEYDPQTNELIAPDGGVVGPPSGGTGGVGGGGGTSAGGVDGAAGGGGTMVTDGGSEHVTDGASSDEADAAPDGAGACTGPALLFSNPITGDANPLFTSGVAVQSGETLFIFSGYRGPLPADGGADAAATGNEIYVQAFNAETGASLGPTAPFLSVEDGPSFFVNEVSVTPAGEIALLYSHAISGQTAASALFASFLTTTTTAPDGGAPTLSVQKTVQLESVELEQPHVIWSSGRQTFVFSWKYFGASWFGRIKTFEPNGMPATGGTGSIPTMSGVVDVEEDDMTVGAVGPLLGTAVRNTVTYQPQLTVLGADGLQVGDFVQLFNQQIGGWVSVAGTADGFISFFNSSSTVYGVFAPTTGSNSVLADGGAPDAGPPTAKQFVSFSSTVETGRAISDDTGGAGGVGLGILESDGALFVYVTADTAKQYMLGTVISTALGSQIAVTNYRGSFGVSLYLASTGATKVVTSSCGQ